LTFNRSNISICKRNSSGCYNNDS